MYVRHDFAITMLADVSSKPVEPPALLLGAVGYRRPPGLYQPGNRRDLAGATLQGRSYLEPSRKVHPHESASQRAGAVSSSARGSGCASCVGRSWNVQPSVPCGYQATLE